MRNSYIVYGLALQSNCPIPGLEVARSPHKSVDIEVQLGSPPTVEAVRSSDPELLIFVSSALLESGEPSLRIWSVAEDRFLRMDYFDGVQFWLEREGRAIWARWPETSSLEDAAMYLMGPVLGVLLRMRGITCLHASAVVIDDHAVAFVGDEGAGKSTTAASFARRGNIVLSDDIVALTERDGGFYVMPAHPYLSLWPASVEILYGPDKTLPRFSANVEKRMLSLARNHLRFAEEPLPLDAIFLLGERSTDPAAPFFETVAPQESLLSLLANSYATRLLTQDTRAGEFALLGRLLSLVPVRRVRPSEDPARIDLLCDRIEEECRTMRDGSPLKRHGAHN